MSPGHQYYPWHKAGKEDTQVIRTYEEIAHQITTQIFGFVCQTYDLTLTCSAKESFLRLMQYPTLTSKMAPPDYHDDVGLLALAPCSNVGAGLQFRFLPWTRKIIELETVLEADEVVVFPGMSLEFASGGRIRAVKHNVRYHTPSNPIPTSWYSRPLIFFGVGYKSVPTHFFARPLLGSSSFL